MIPHLREFQRHLAGHASELRITAANDFRRSDERYQEQRKTGIFNQYGVYLIFDDNESLEYVSVVMNRFNDRIWPHGTYLNRLLTKVIPIPREYY